MATKLPAGVAASFLDTVEKEWQERRRARASTNTRAAVSGRRAFGEKEIERLEAHESMLLDIDREIREALDALPDKPDDRNAAYRWGLERDDLVSSLEDVQRGYSRSSCGTRLLRGLQDRGVTPYPGCASIWDKRPGLLLTRRQMAEWRKILAELAD